MNSVFLKVLVSLSSNNSKTMQEKLPFHHNFEQGNKCKGQKMQCKMKTYSIIRSFYFSPFSKSSYCTILCYSQQQLFAEFQKPHFRMIKSKDDNLYITFWRDGTCDEGSSTVVSSVSKKNHTF